MVVEPMNTRYRTVKLPSKMLEAVEQLVRGHPECGYSSIADFIKDSVRRHCCWYEATVNSKAFLKATPLFLSSTGENGYPMKTKKVIIIISLVEEAEEEANETIEKEIFKELSEDMPKIPWCKKVEKVEVVEK